MTLPKPSTSLPPDLQHRLARLQRLVVFTREQVRALRREFAIFWRARALETTLVDVQGEVLPFIRALNTLHLQIENADGLLQTIHALPPVKAEEALAACDQAAIVAAAKELGAMGQRLRTDPDLGRLIAQFMGTPAPAPAPAAPEELAERNRQKLEHLQLWSPAPEAIEVAASAEQEAQRKAVGAARKAKIFLNLLDLALQVLGQFGPRVGLLADALRRTRALAGGRPWPEVGREIRDEAKAGQLTPLQQHWLPRVGHLFLQDREAVRVSQQAVEQLEAATQRVEEAKLQRDVVLATPQERLVTVIGGLAPDPRLKSALSHLTCLPLLVRPLPVLSDLFPELPPAGAG